MANVIIRPDWHIPESSITPISEYHNRRSFVKQLGLGAGVAGLSLAGTLEAAAAPKLYPAKRNAKYSPKVVLTNKAWATGYNNFYEFTTSKERVRFLVDKFKTNPWQVEVSGLCDKPFGHRKGQGHLFVYRTESAMKASEVMSAFQSPPMYTRVYTCAC